MGNRRECALACLKEGCATPYHIRRKEMRRKNLWLRLSSCTMAALIATTSIVPVSAAEVEFQDEASAEVAETPETAEAPEEDAAAERCV